MSGLLDCLRDPELVYKTQKFFGIEFSDQKTNEDDVKTLNEKNDKSNLTRRNLKKEESSDYHNETEIIEEESYKVGNLFWHYLFIIGTELGDEVSFIRQFVLKL